MYVQELEEEPYVFSLQKTDITTSIYGLAWKRFTEDYNLQPGDLIQFKFPENAAFPMKVTPHDDKYNLREKITDASEEGTYTS